MKLNAVVLDKRKSSNISISELFLFYALLAAAVFAVYIKTALGLPFFMLLLLLSFFSKRNYFWIALFFIFLQEPAGFFMYTQSSHLPFIQAIPRISLTPMDLFTVLMLFKMVINKSHLNFRLKTPLIFLGLYIAGSFFISAIFSNTSIDVTARFSRSLIYMMWIFFTAAFLRDINDFLKFLELLLPITIFILLSQIYFILKGEQLIALFNPEANIIILNSLTGEARAWTGGFLLLFCCYFSAFFLMQFKQNKKRENYYYIISIICFLVAIIAATRFLFGIFFFMAVMIYGRKLKEMPKIVILAAGAVILLLFLIKIGIFSSHYLKYSLWARVSQIFDFAAGKGAEIDTVVSRLDQLKYMIDAISKKPFFGYGFTEEALLHVNNNWGFQNTLVMFGFFGFFLFIWLFKAYFRLITVANRRPYAISEAKAALKILLVTFFGMLLGYFTTWDFFSLFYPSVVVFNMVFFSLSEVFVNKIESEKNNTMETKPGANTKPGILLFKKRES